MAEFRVPQIDFSFLSNLPKEFELGRQAGRENQLRSALSKLPMKDGVTDWDTLINTVMPIDPIAGIQMYQTIHPPMTPYQQQELALSRQRLEQGTMTPAMKEYNWAYGGQAGAPVQTGGQPQQMTPAEFLQRRAARGSGALLPQPQGELKIGTYYDSMDRLSEAAKKIRDDPNLYTATGVAGQLPTIMGGSPKARLQAKINALKAQVGFNALQAMRDASKTGGAVGQVSNFEQQLFQQQLGSLDPAALGEEGFKEALDGVIAYTEAAKDRMGSAFEETYGAPFVPKGKTGQTVGPGMTTTEAPSQIPGELPSTQVRQTPEQTRSVLEQAPPGATGTLHMSDGTTVKATKREDGHWYAVDSGKRLN